MIIYKFRLLSPEVDDFYCDIAIRNDQSFLDLHEIIQDICEYDKSQMASFFLTNKSWEKERQITLIEMDGEAGGEVLIMEKCLLLDYVKAPKQKLLYVFDFFSERAFYMELVSIDVEKKDKYYPVCISQEGDPPQQIMIGDIVLDSMFNIEDDDPEDDDEAIQFENIDDYDDL